MSNEPIRLGVIECGRDRPELRRRFGRYSDMFVRLLAPVAPEIEIDIIDIVAGEGLEAPIARDAWLIGGSPAGVYDDDPWIAQLGAFLKEAYAAETPLVGVCFGHQMLADALGGRVVKSPKGWGCGVHEYSLHAAPAWMRAETTALRLRAMHQDQIVELPPEATRLAGSEFCPNAALVYGEAEAPKAFSMQPHPEFEADFAAALIELRAKDAIPAAVADDALRSLVDAPDKVMGTTAARWIAEFLRVAVARRRSGAG